MDESIRLRHRAAAMTLFECSARKCRQRAAGFIFEDLQLYSRQAVPVLLVMSYWHLPWTWSARGWITLAAGAFKSEWDWGNSGTRISLWGLMQRMVEQRPQPFSSSGSVLSQDQASNWTHSPKPNDPWDVDVGPGPFVGLAVHAGHDIRTGLRAALAIDETTRLREEDPFTDGLAALCGTRILTSRSRFEVDLNRPSDESVCVQPDDCWNLRVWKQSDGLTQTMYRRSLEEHSRFYEMLGDRLKEIKRREGRFVVLDCHSYNHRRAGPEEPPADPQQNPEINVGTGSMDRAYWAPVVEAFLSSLAAADYQGRHLDVRENVKFRGRYLAEFVHTNFPRTGCCLAIEVKKFFMDEWTGQLDRDAFGALLGVFRKALGAVEDAVRSMQ